MMTLRGLLSQFNPSVRFRVVLSMPMIVEEAAKLLPAFAHDTLRDFRLHVGIREDEIG